MFKQRKIIQDAREQGMSDDDIVTAIIAQYMGAGSSNAAGDVMGQILTLIDPSQISFNLEFIDRFMEQAAKHPERVGGAASLVAEIAIMKMGRAEDIAQEDKRPFVDRAFKAIETAIRLGVYQQPEKALLSIPDLITSNVRAFITSEHIEKAFTILRDTTQGQFIGDDQEFLYKREESDIIACAYRTYVMLVDDMKRNGQLDTKADMLGAKDGFNFVESAPGSWDSKWAYSDPYQQRFCVEYAHKQHAPIAEALEMFIEDGPGSREEVDDVSPELLVQLALKAYDAGLSYAAPELTHIAPLARAADARHLFEPETLDRLQPFMPPPAVDVARRRRLLRGFSGITAQTHP